jgi:hypothetical protein
MPSGQRMPALVAEGRKDDQEEVADTVLPVLSAYVMNRREELRKSASGISWPDGLYRITIKFANSPCACRDSRGQKPQYGLTTYYLEVLKRLREKVTRKGPEVFVNNSWILHHDNAPAHTALSGRKFLASKQITVLEHPPCSWI